MTIPQRAILFTGLLVFLLLGIFPPWYAKAPIERGYRYRMLGHGPLWKQPNSDVYFTPAATDVRAKALKEARQAMGLPPTEIAVNDYDAFPDYRRLALEWVLVLVGTLGGVLLVAPARRTKSAQPQDKHKEQSES
jgi:hypothetical protein